MKIKKRTIFVITILLCVGVLLCACGETKNESESTELTDASTEETAVSEEKENDTSEEDFPFDEDGIYLPEDGKIEFGKQDSDSGKSGNTATEDGKPTQGGTPSQGTPTTPTQGGTPSQGTTTTPTQGNSGSQTDPTAAETEPTQSGDDGGWGDVDWN